MDAVRAHLAQRRGAAAGRAHPGRRRALPARAGRRRGRDGRARGALRRADRRGGARARAWAGPCSAGWPASGCSRRSPDARRGPRGRAPRASCARWRRIVCRAAGPARDAARAAGARSADWAAAGRTGRDRQRRSGGLFGEYQRTLRGSGAWTPSSALCSALDALRREPALWGGTPVLFYGFDDLARLQLDAIETLGRVVGAPVTVSLAYEPGRAAFAGRAVDVPALRRSRTSTASWTRAPTTTRPGRARPLASSGALAVRGARRARARPRGGGAAAGGSGRARRARARGGRDRRAAARRHGA